jgi:hypothetical protein
MENILWGTSYTNLVMLISSIPSYSPDKNKKAKDLEIKDVNDIEGLI